MGPPCAEHLLSANQFMPTTPWDPKSDPTAGACLFQLSFHRKPRFQPGISRLDPAGQQECQRGLVQSWHLKRAGPQGRGLPARGAGSPTPRCPQAAPGLQVEHQDRRPDARQRPAASSRSLMSQQVYIPSFKIPEVIRPDGRAACQFHSLPHAWFFFFFFKSRPFSVK